jgi:hypothetical protein
MGSQFLHDFHGLFPSMFQPSWSKSHGPGVASLDGPGLAAHGSFRCHCGRCWSCFGAWLVIMMLISYWYHNIHTYIYLILTVIKFYYISIILYWYLCLYLYMIKLYYTRTLIMFRKTDRINEGPFKGCMCICWPWAIWMWVTLQILWAREPPCWSWSPLTKVVGNCVADQATLAA